MKIIIMLLCIHFLLSCNDSEKKPPVKKIPFASYYDNGSIFRKGFYSEIRPNGYGLFQDTVLEGKYQQWYDNGQKEIEAIYSGNKKNGSFQTWYRNGQKFEKGSYEKGKLHRSYRVWFDDGTLELAGHFYKGKKDSIYQKYYSNSQIRIQEKYVNSEPIDSMIQWYKSGNIAKVTFFSEPYSLQWQKMWYADSSLKQEITKIGENKYHVKYWYPDGSAMHDYQLTQTFDDREQAGTVDSVKSWTPTGDLVLKCDYTFQYKEPDCRVKGKKRGGTLDSIFFNIKTFKDI